MAKDHLLQSSVGQVDEIFSLGGVTVPRLLLAKVVRCVVVLQDLQDWQDLKDWQDWQDLQDWQDSVVVLQDLHQHFHHLRVNVPPMPTLAIGTWYMVHGIWNTLCLKLAPELHMCTGTWQARQGRQAPCILVAED